MQDLGCAYWGITDHSRASYVAKGMDAARLLEQSREIRRLNESYAKEDIAFRFISGAEVDILPDGRLDYEDDLLAQLDLVVASVHSSFQQSEAEMTRRLIRAIENPYVHIVGHLTGRLLLEREPYQLDTNAVIDACAANGTWIELNCGPRRFDMDWRLWRQAKEKGVKCVINADAHRNEHAGFLRLGASVARKGWLEKRDVMNTLPYDALMAELKRKRARAGVI